MSPAHLIAAIAKRIEARMAEEPDARGDFFRLTPAGREAVQRILDEALPREAAP